MLKIMERKLLLNIDQTFTTKIYHASERLSHQHLGLAWIGASADFGGAWVFLH